MVPLVPDAFEKSPSNAAVSSPSTLVTVLSYCSKNEARSDRRRVFPFSRLRRLSANFPLFGSRYAVERALPVKVSRATTQSRPFKRFTVSVLPLAGGPTRRSHTGGADG